MIQFLTYIKDPNATLDYTILWAEWLAEVADTISVSTWLLDDGITEVTSTNTDTDATVWISGGTVNNSYNATNRIVTTNGRTDDRTITLKIRQK